MKTAEILCDLCHESFFKIQIKSLNLHWSNAPLIMWGGIYDQLWAQDVILFTLKYILFFTSILNLKGANRQEKVEFNTFEKKIEKRFFVTFGYFHNQF